MQRRDRARHETYKQRCLITVLRILECVFEGTAGNHSLSGSRIHTSPVAQKQDKYGFDGRTSVVDVCICCKGVANVSTPYPFH